MHRGLAQKRSSSHEACGSSKAEMRSRRHGRFVWCVRLVRPHTQGNPGCAEYGELLLLGGGRGRRPTHRGRGDPGVAGRRRLHSKLGFATVELDAGVCV